MFSSRRKTFWRSFRRRLRVGLALVAYLAVAGGVPLPASSARKDAGQPFPCMNNPCGCETAEQCWGSCCCLTPEERWAWAEAHGVTPPDYAERPAPPGEAEPAKHSCCSKEGCHDGCCEPEGKPAATSRPGVRWVVGASALRCRGLATEWATTGAVLPPDVPAAWEPRPVTGAWVRPAASLASPLPESPPSPPPR